MKTANRILISIAAIATLTVSPLISQESADAIMKKNDGIPSGQSFKREMTLLVIKQGVTEKKEFTGFSKKQGRSRRSLMQFTHPTEMGFLVWDNPGEESQQWIKLSGGRVRRIASTDKGKPWMNSHFYNDDVSEKYIEDYKYELIGGESVNGTPCYKIRSVKKGTGATYSKTEVYIGKEDYLTYRVDYFEGGRHVKTLTLTRYENILNIPTARMLTMERADGKGKSVLYIKSIRYNISIDDRELTREALAK
ncbi:MAG: outer membrane lipoprotein-sorting protein [Spirochaetes bacterium]|nr:outer membrane lipoprotein-sorting protein [Spirochaetota bacterium]MBN2769363.1 outer membrane lipoprotein-sorting protein [Spirochaetota bacterium]